MKKSKSKKTSKRAYRILKIIWFMFGGLIVLWTVFWYIKSITIQDLAVIATIALFASGIYMLSIYLSITILFIAIKWAVKKIRK